MPRSSLKIVSVAHSYAVALNRRLADEIAREGKGRWDVKAVGPLFFHGSRDLRPITFEASVDEKIEVEAVPAHLTRRVHIFNYGKRLKEIIRGGCDLVHAWEEPYIVAGAQIAYFTPKDTPLVYATFQNQDKKYPPPFNWMEHYAMRRSAGWIAFGETIREALEHRGGYADRPFTVIPVGVDTNFFQPDEAARRVVRGEVGWDDSVPVVGFLGRFIPEKGIDLLTRALDRVTVPWRVLFVGAGTMEPQLRAWAATHGDRVKIRNDVRHAQVPRYLNAMDILAAPSQTTKRWREQFGRMLIEAFACGLAVVGSDSGEIPFVIGDAGIVCGEADEDAWVNGLTQLLADADKRQDFSRRGIARVHERYAWPVIARRHIEFFDKVRETSSAVRNFVPAALVRAGDYATTVIPSNNGTVSGTPSILAVCGRGGSSGAEERIRALLKTVPFHYFAIDPTRRARSSRWLYRTIVVERPDLVFLQRSTFWSALAILGARWRTGVQFVVSDEEHTQAAQSMPGLLRRWLYAGAAAFVGDTQDLMNRACAKGCGRALVVAADADVDDSAGRVGDLLNSVLVDRAPVKAKKDTPRVHPVKVRRRLLSLAHSYAVGQNRRLVDEMSKVGGDRWDITAVTPNYFHGKNDLRPVEFERMPSEEAQRIEVLPAHLTGHVHFFYYGRRLKQILREGWDMVHCWEEPYIVAGGQVARWTPREVPIVYRTAQSLVKRYPPPFNWLEQSNMRRASGWICSGTLVAKTLKQKQIYRDRPMRLIPLGVDIDFFKPNKAAGDECRRALGWDAHGPPVIGYLGRFVPEKGMHILMQALSDLQTPWRALFVGAGPAEQQLRDWAEQFPNRVRVCTDVRHAQVPAYLNAMDIMAAPSQTTPKWREQFGRMLVEAFASGVPLIGSDSGEVPFVIDDCGIICPEGDAKYWTRELEAILNAPERRREFAERGIERARERFAWPVVARAYLEFFDELVAPRAAFDLSPH